MSFQDKNTALESFLAETEAREEDLYEGCAVYKMSALAGDVLSCSNCQEAYGPCLRSSPSSGALRNGPVISVSSGIKGCSSGPDTEAAEAGDFSNIALWIIIGCIAAECAGCVVLRRKLG